MDIIVNGIKLNYEVFGEGIPLILLHGNRESYEIFLPLIEQLKSTFKIYAIDSRNHGKSEYTKKFNYEIMAEDIYEFIIKLELKGASIVGFSDGAIIGLHLALKDSKILNKLVLLGVNVTPKGLEKAFYEAYKNDLDPYNQMMFKQKPIRGKDLNKITNNTLIVYGEHDVITRQQQLRIYKNIMNSKYISLIGEDHASYILKPDKLHKLIYDFISIN